MLRRRPLGALLVAAVIAVAGWSFAPGGGEPAAGGGDPAPVPAPPPATCRVAPSPAGWGDYAADPASADLSPFQDYRAAMGIGDGVRGGGVTVADVEYEWRAQHVELAGLALPSPPPNNLDPAYRSAEHGTAVLGILAGSPDGKGVSGLVPDADIRPISPFTTNAVNPGGGYNPAAAVRTAARQLGPGDVLLIELQAVVQLPQGGSVFGPIESIENVRDAVRAAVDKGIVVVEPAGNGNTNLADLGVSWLAGQTAPGHSGALIVGAGGSDQDATGPSARRRVVGSNYGSRVDVQGVGVGVVTSGYGDGIGGADDRAYTSCFDGTSSASATVAAAVAALQSGAKAQNAGAVLRPGQVRALLTETGLPQSVQEDGVIGPRPQVDLALARLAGAPPPADPGLPSAQPVGPTGSVRAVPVAPNGRNGKAAPAASAVTVRYVKAGGRLTIRLRGLAKGAKVTAGGRPAKVVGNAVVLRKVKPGRFVVVVTPPARLRASRTTLKVVVVVAKGGTAKVIRL